MVADIPSGPGGAKVTARTGHGRRHFAYHNRLSERQSRLGDRARRERIVMPKRIRRSSLTVPVVSLLVLGPVTANASQTTIAINATVVEVQCTPAQRARIRACAPAQESVTMQPAKTVVRVPSTGVSATMTGAPYEIRLDPTRKVLIKTILY